MTNYDHAQPIGPPIPTRRERLAARHAARMVELRERPLSGPTDHPMTADDLVSPGRSVFTAGDARHVLALDQWADELLRDSLAAERADIDGIDAMTPRAATAAIQHAIRDAGRDAGVALDTTGIRRASKVGSGRSERRIAGGYVERAYASVVSGPTASASVIASESIEDHAERVSWSDFCDSAVHTTTLAAAAHEYGHSLAYDPDVYAPTFGRGQHGARLSWPARRSVPSARHRTARPDVTTPDLVTYATVERPVLSDRLLHGAMPLPVGRTCRVVSATTPSFPCPTNLAPSERGERVALMGEVTECVGPWLADGADGSRRYWQGHRVVVTTPRKSKTSEARAALSLRADVAAAIARVLAGRATETIAVYGRPVTLTPAKRGKVTWRTTSKRGGGKAGTAKQAANVAGRILKACAA